MTSIYKIAQEYEESVKKSEEAGHKMCKYTAILHALAVIHQHSHWKVRGMPSYGDHLLFQRLYEGVTDHFDTAAEKTIGVFGNEHIQLDVHSQIMNEFIQDVLQVISEGDESNDFVSFAKRSLAAEEAFLKYSQELYDSLKESGDLTLGIDDMIMSIYSDHETFVYLLKQNLASRL